MPQISIGNARQTLKSGQDESYMKTAESSKTTFAICFEMAMVIASFPLLTGCDTPEGSMVAAGLFNANAGLATNPKQALLWSILGHTAATDAQMQNQREVAEAGRTRIEINQNSATPNKATYVEKCHFDNGCVYTGPIEWIEPTLFKPTGRGYMENLKMTGGKIYTGFGYADGAQWVTDGQGELIWPSGDKYEGEFKNNKLSGQGTYTKSNGAITKGIWIEGQCDRGIMNDSLGSNIMFERHNKHYNREGTYVWPDGTQFTGVWTYDGKSSGTISWKDGREYKGDWKLVENKQDLPDGEGTLTWPGGEKYVGGFKDGKMEGFGKLTYADGQVEEGTWKDDAFVGKQPQSEAANESSQSNSSLKGSVVTIEGDDAALEIFVDGTFVGNVPARLKFYEGIHVIEVKKTGFRDYRREIQIVEDSTLNIRPILEKN